MSLQFAEETSEKAEDRSPMIHHAEGTNNTLIQKRLKEGKGARSGYTLNSIIFLTLALILMMMVSATGLNAFEQNEFVSVPDKFVTQTASEFYGLMIFSIVGPLTLLPACALLKECSLATDLSPNIRCMFLLIQCAAWAGVASWSGKTGGNEVMECLFLWCGEYKTAEAHGRGWVYTTHAMIQIGSIILCILSFCLAVRNYLGVHSKNLNGYKQIATRKKYINWKRYRIVAFAVALLPFCWVSEMVLPTNFEGFSRGNMYKFRTLHKDDWVSGGAAMHLPEKTDAVWTTKFWEWNSEYVVKMFPDVVIWFIFLYCLVVLGLAYHAFPSVGDYKIHFPALKWPLDIRSWSKCDWRITKPWTFTKLRVVELTFIITWFIASICFIVYFARDHSYHKGEAKTSLEIAARTVGLYNGFNMGVLLLPVARTSVIPDLLGVGWETGLWLHRIAGFLFWFLGLLHMILFWALWSTQTDTLNGGNILSNMIFSIPDGTKESQPYPAPGYDNFTVTPMTFIFLFICLPAMAFTSFWSIRRANFEIFYWAHQLFLVLIFCIVHHANSMWMFTLVGCIVLACDRILRLWRSSRPMMISKLVIQDETTHIVVKPLDEGAFKWIAGQYAFITLPWVSRFESHPFTISSAPSDQEITFHIKDMGGDTFTGNLKDLSYRGIGQTMSLDGPYGSPPELINYSRVLIVAGGIGVTPCHSIFREMVLQDLGDNRVHLLWISRKAQLFTMFMDTLDKAGGGESRFTYSLFADEDATLRGPEWLKEKVQAGRPNLGAIFDKLNIKGSSSFVFACGPGGLVRAVEACAEQRECGLHMETFFL